MRTAAKTFKVGLFLYNKIKVANHELKVGSKIYHVTIHTEESIPLNYDLIITDKQPIELSSLPEQQRSLQCHGTKLI